MQVFIIGSPLDTAIALDRRRLNRQIQEVKIILDALNGSKAWSNHPCVLQYRGNEEWLKMYFGCLLNYQSYLMEDSLSLKDTFLIRAKIYNHSAKEITPSFHNEMYFTSMKKRLYTKDKEHYKQWSYLGESLENLYYVNGEWRVYINGKKTIEL